ncbi:MAG: hypothetical protein JWN40_1844 [Phycisphaerales bacterium]|nr:hypothetical protein [Phycisphaerales bacterium]
MSKITIMTVQQEILERLSTLAPAQQQEILRLARDLSAHTNKPHGRPWTSMMGLLAGRGIDVTADDIAEARREMWGEFPREII